MSMIWNVRTQQRRIISKKFFVENSYTFSCDEKKSHTLGKCTYSLCPDENEGGDELFTLTGMMAYFLQLTHGGFVGLTDAVFAAHWGVWTIAAVLLCSSRQ